MKTYNVSIKIHESWIEDGFELTEEKLKDAILTHLLGYAFDHEVEVKIKRSKEV